MMLTTRAVNSSRVRSFCRKGSEASSSCTRLDVVKDDITERANIWANGPINSSANWIDAESTLARAADEEERLFFCFTSVVSLVEALKSPRPLVIRFLELGGEGDCDRDRFLLFELPDRSCAVFLSFEDLWVSRALDFVGRTLRLARGELGAEDKGDEKGERDDEGSEDL
jgi:hypothetical protein